MWIETVSAWINALKLPGRVVFGLFLFCAGLLLLDLLGILLPYGWPLVLVATLLFGCLSLAAAGGEGYEAWKHSRAEKKVRARQQAKRDESELAREKHKALVLKRLDYLSRDEHRILADQLRMNERSFESWVHSSPVQNLMAAGLVGTPGATAHGDHYPFFIVDFVWEGLLARRDEFLAKDDENQRREAEEERKKREEGQRRLRRGF